MAWIKISTREVLNADNIKTIEIRQYSDGVCYIKFSLNGDDSFTSKKFERIEECLELFNKIWSAVADNLSIDVS